MIAEQLEAHFKARFEPDPPPRKRRVSRHREVGRRAVRHRRARTRACRRAEPKPQDQEQEARPGSSIRQPATPRWPSTATTCASPAAGRRAIDIAEVRRFGATRLDRLEIVLSNGQLIVFDREEQHHHPRALGQDDRQLHARDRRADHACRTGRQVKVYRSLCILADAPPEQREQRGTAGQLLDDFVGWSSRDHRTTTSRRRKVASTRSSPAMPAAHGIHANVANAHATDRSPC